MMTTTVAPPAVEPNSSATKKAEAIQKTTSFSLRARIFGFVFVIPSLFLSFSLGIGLWAAIKLLGSMTFWAVKFAGLFALFCGLWHFSDGVCRKSFRCNSELPRSWLMFLKGLFCQVTSPFSAFVVGAFSWFIGIMSIIPSLVFVCSLLAQFFSLKQALVFLAAFSLVSTSLPIFVSVAAIFGLQLARLGSTRNRLGRIFHSIVGVLLVILGLSGMLDKIVVDIF